jgi:hypothetical protein
MYTVDRFVIVKKGFRAKMSRGWFVFKDGRNLPVEGPYTLKADAIKQRKAMEESSMGEKDKATKDAEKTAEKDAKSTEKVTERTEHQSEKTERKAGKSEEDDGEDSAG